MTEFIILICLRIYVIFSLNFNLFHGSQIIKFLCMLNFVIFISSFVHLGEVHRLFFYDCFFVFFSRFHLLHHLEILGMYFHLPHQQRICVFMYNAIMKNYVKNELIFKSAASFSNRLVFQEKSQTNIIL